MVLAPKVFYKMQMLPIPLPQIYLKKLTQILNGFVWNNKKPRVAHRVICREKAQGGLAMPDFKKYFNAIVIARAVDWVKGGHNKRWVSLEMGLSGARLKYLLWNPPRFRKLGPDTHIITQLTFKTWDLMHTNNSWEYNSPLIHLKNNELFPPGREGVGGNWIINNETQLKDITKNGKICTFQHLVTQKYTGENAY